MCCPFFPSVLFKSTCELTFCAWCSMILSSGDQPAFIYLWASLHFWTIGNLEPPRCRTSPISSLSLCLPKGKVSRTVPEFSLFTPLLPHPYFFHLTPPYSSAPHPFLPYPNLPLTPHPVRSLTNVSEISSAVTKQKTYGRGGGGGG